MNPLRVAFRNDVVVRSIKVSATIGTLLVAINHGDTLLSANFPAELYWKIPLTYAVPYLVSTYASVSAILDRRQQ